MGVWFFLGEGQARYPPSLLNAIQELLGQQLSPNDKMTKESFWPVASLSAAVLATANLSTPPAGCSDQYPPQKAP